MAKEIRIQENGLSVVFGVRENGVVELQRFCAAEVCESGEKTQEIKENPEIYYPVVEVQITGKGTRNMHGYKHNMSGGSLDFQYTGHVVEETAGGKNCVFP